MESNGPGAMAVHMASNFDPFARDLDTFDDVHNATLSADPAVEEAHEAYMAPTAQQVFHNHPRPSNMRATEGSDNDNKDGAQSVTPGLFAGANLANNIKNEQDAFDNPEPISAVSEMSLSLEEMKGYAQLVFPDGEYLVTSTEIMLGRDERAQHILKEQERRQRKVLREQVMRQARQHAAEMDAQAALERYELEPRTGSEEGRRGSSTSSLILEGRPAPGVPSTFSETGGIVNYEGSDPHQKRLRRRHHLLSRSSSTTTNSVAPASLHVYGAATTPWGSNEHEKCVFLPIHPFQIEDIRKISKEHLRIFYDGVEKHWKMEIKGNGAFVLNELYKETTTDIETGDEDTAPRHFKRGDTVILTHNSEVLVTSLTFLFKLPQRRGFSTVDSDDNAEDDLETSLTQQHTELDDGSDLSDSDQHMKQEHDDIDAQATAKRPKILLKASKPRPVAEPDSPEPPRFTGGKGKKKPVEAPKPTESEAVCETEDNNDNGQMLPPVFDANSTLQHVPVNELPEKRKGPGRPPKNGLVSKRDEGIIRRKMKEYEKRGERPPPYKDILAIVRAENRAKELASRAAARGEPMPSTQLDMMSVVPTTELDQMNDTPDMSITDLTQLAEASNAPQTASQELDSSDVMKAAQQQQRTYKSPSPMKPKEEYTEEQLRRPTQTYYYILDEILSEGPEDAMELQQIYDKICKKYPFYKYVVESTGWQSSVRHNLKQNERFKPVSKQGKGWLWAIDPAIPLDKEKKKKPTPPPMPRLPMQYNSTGSYQPYQSQTYTNGMPQYHQQPQQPQQPSYSAPYSGTSQAYAHPLNGQAPVQQSTPNSTMPAASPLTAAQAPPQPAVPRTLSHPPSRPASNTPQPGPPGALPPAFQDLVEEIMRFRVEYLSPFGKEAQEYARHERIFKRCVEWISQLHMRQNPEVKFENDEERRVFQILEKMRHKFEQGASSIPAKTVPTQAQVPAPTQAFTQAQPSPPIPSAQSAVPAQAQSSQMPQPMQSVVSTQAQQTHKTQFASPHSSTSNTGPIPSVSVTKSQNGENLQQHSGQPSSGPMLNTPPSHQQASAIDMSTSRNQASNAGSILNSALPSIATMPQTQASQPLNSSSINDNAMPAGPASEALDAQPVTANDAHGEIHAGTKRAATSDAVDDEHDEKRAKV